jgi:hypothetical protein
MTHIAVHGWLCGLQCGLTLSLGLEFVCASACVQVPCALSPRDSDSYISYFYIL